MQLKEKKITLSDWTRILLGFFGLNSGMDLVLFGLLFSTPDIKINEATSPQIHRSFPFFTLFVVVSSVRSSSNP